MLRRPDASRNPARPICYADDLRSFASSLPGLQDTAALVSFCSMVFNLSVAVHKLLAFHYYGLSAPPEDQEALIIHSAGWTPHTALIRTNGTFKSLGVEYPSGPPPSSLLRGRVCLDWDLMALATTRPPTHPTCSSSGPHPSGQRIGVIAPGASVAHHRLRAALLEPDHRNPYDLHLQHTRWLQVRHILPSLSPTLRTIASQPSNSQLYHGRPIDIDSCFPEILGSYSMPYFRASRVTMV